MSWMLPAVVAIPLFTAALITGGDHVLPRRLQDAMGIAAAGASCALSLILLTTTERHDVLHWAGGWQPRQGVAIGIDLAVDPLGAGMSALAAGLVFLALIFSFTYLRDSSRHLDALMLVFCAGMCGFSLAGDLFNMFVWFEVMGVAAYALAAFKVEELGPVQGAFNFAITNTVAAYLILIGIALIYGRTGALNLAQIGQGLERHGHEPLVGVAMTLVLVGFLVKAAAVPFHFWLADAHAAAPAPVCVLFSGAMVELGLFAVARVYWTAFAGPASHAALVHDSLLWIGLITALVGAVMCFLQSHLKRLLAYSTISHVGVMLAAIGLLGGKALAGAANLVLSHAFLKGGLFLACGVILQRLRRIGEVHLHGRGRALPLLGVLWVLGAIGLIGIPYVGSFLGHSLIDDAASVAGKPWVGPIAMVSAGVCSGAMLRAGARVFLGWGPKEDPLLSPEPEEEPEEREVALVPMMAVVGVMIGLGLVASAIPGLEGRTEHAALRFRDQAAYTAQVLHGRRAPGTPHVPATVQPAKAESIAYGVGAAAIALATAAFGLWRRRLPGTLRGAARTVLRPGVHGLRAVHSGAVGDYLTWLAIGAATFGTLWGLAVHA